MLPEFGDKNSDFHVKVNHLSTGCPLPADKLVSGFNVAAHGLVSGRHLLDATLMLVDAGHDVRIVAVSIIEVKLYSIFSSFPRRENVDTL
jgi:hypothetical protein